MKEKTLEVPSPFPSTITVWSALLGHLLRNRKSGEFTCCGSLKPQTKSSFSPGDDEVVSRAAVGGRLGGGPAGVGHYGDQVAVQPLRLQLQPHLLVQLDLGARLHAVLESAVGVGGHRQSVVPSSGYDLQYHRAAERTHTHTHKLQLPQTTTGCRLTSRWSSAVLHSPVFDPEGQALDVWLCVEAGEVDLDLVLAGDDAVLRAVPRRDGVLVEDLAVVHLC